MPRGIPGFDQGQRKIYQILIDSLNEFFSQLAFHKKPIKHKQVIQRFYVYLHYSYYIHLLIHIYIYIYIHMTCLCYLYEFDIIGPFRFLEISIPVPCDFSVYISKKLRHKAAFLRLSCSHKSHNFPSLCLPNYLDICIIKIYLCIKYTQV